MKRSAVRLGVLAGLTLVLTDCSAVIDARTSIADGLMPKLSAADAVAITRNYLDEQTPELAVPGMHRSPRVNSIWAVTADKAAAIDGCIPPRTSTQIVWITKGVGDYLNLHDWPWSHYTRQADGDSVEALTCGGPGPAGTIVIDDATGSILGVYPEGAPYFHSPAGPTS